MIATSDNSVPQKKGPQYNASSSLGTEADTDFQYGKENPNAKGNQGDKLDTWDQEAPGGNA